MLRQEEQKTSTCRNRTINLWSKEELNKKIEVLEKTEKFGYDPLRQGRFIIIVEQRKNSLYKANEKDAL